MATTPTLNDAGPFEAKINPGILVNDQYYIHTPTAFDIMRDGEPDFDEFCQASRTVADAVSDNQELAEAIAILLNRAYVLGAGGMGEAHVTPRA